LLGGLSKALLIGYGDKLIHTLPEVLHGMVPL
jgi:hypothetical protein